ncbi:DUF192 domain-containing protein [Candidatus Omnitrophota bacterium]
MKIINQTRNTLLADNATLARTFLARIKGLLGKKGLKENHALIIQPCNSIHTFFMRFVIDVIFLDKQHKVVGLRESMPPGRISRIYPQAHTVVELPAHVIRSTRTQIHDVLGIE